MSTSKVPVLGLGLLILALGVISCGNLASVFGQGNSVLESATKPKVPVTPIQDVAKQDTTNSLFYLEGKVGKTVPLLGSQVYELVDESGKIWVVTQATPLNSGDSLVIQGIVRQQKISVAGQDLGEIYVEEQNQLFRVPINPIPKTNGT